MFMPQQDEIDHMKDSFYEDKFRKYHMKILFGDLNAEVGRETIFKRAIGN
jgi:hypothetical protein